MTIFIAVLLSLVTLGFIVYPLFRREDDAADDVPSPGLPDADIEAEIEARVRALRRAPARFCTGCGARLKEGDRFCHQCGQRVD